MNPDRAGPCLAPTKAEHAEDRRQARVLKIAGLEATAARNVAILLRLKREGIKSVQQFLGSMTDDELLVASVGELNTRIKARLIAAGRAYEDWFLSVC